VSIVQSIDAEISGVQEEIGTLERQLGAKQIHLSKLQDLRKQAATVENGEGGASLSRARHPRRSLTRQGRSRHRMATSERSSARC
jgi:hypothetical protein